MTPTDRAALSTVPVPGRSFDDGLGHRSQTMDASGEGAEHLCLRPELSAVPSFEFALRERVARLAGFRHAYYGRVRSVERLSDGASTLAVVSDHTPGTRLSTVLALAEARHVALDINAALCLLRQLVPAVATLHERARDVAHGAIGPERLVLSNNARLVIVEYVMGAALEQLRYSPDRYWHDLRIPTVALSGFPRFDQRADVAQLGLVALALILGRPVQADEYPGRLNDLVASTWAVSSRGGFEPLPPGLRGWLARALQLDARNGFASAIEARAELEKVMGDSDLLASPASLEAFLARYQAADHPTPSMATAPSLSTDTPSRSSRYEETPKARVDVAHDVATESLFVGPSPAPWDLPRPDVQQVGFAPPLDRTRVQPNSAALEDPAHETTRCRPSAESTPAVEPVRGASTMTEVDVPAPTAVSRAPELGAVRPPAPAAALPPAPVRAAVPVSVPTFGHAPLESLPSEDAHRSRWPRLAAAAGVLVVLGGGLLGWQRYATAGGQAAASGTLAVDSNPTGVDAYVDGVLRGKTPLSLVVAPGEHRLELRGAGAPRVVPVTVGAGGQVSQYIELPKSDPTAGQLQIRTEPAGAKVAVDGVSVGVSPMTVIDLAPGEHTVSLEGDNTIVRQTVKVDAGATSSLIVPLATAASSPASGWIAVAAPFEVQLFEQGRLLGSSRSDRIMLPSGRHEIDLVSEEVGFTDTRTVQVGSGKTFPLRIEAPTGTIALNAVPWAEVWIDGEKLGDTPIGNHALPLGRHDVLFRHPDLGEQHHTAVVTLKAPARLSVDMRKK